MAALNKTSNYLGTLVAQGNDAHSNIFLANFSAKGVEDDKIITLGTIRCDGFTQPSASQDSYTVKFLNIHIDRPRAKVSMDKYFDLTFRVDGNYQMYKMLKYLQGLNVNENKDQNLSNINLAGIEGQALTISVVVPGKNGANITLFNAKGCWIESVTPVAFKQGTSDPIKVTARINYLYPEDWQGEIVSESTTTTT